MITGIEVLAFIGWMIIAWLTVSVIIGAITVIQFKMKGAEDALACAMLIAIVWPAFAWQWFIEHNFSNEDDYDE